VHVSVGIAFRVDQLWTSSILRRVVEKASVRCRARQAFIFLVVVKFWYVTLFLLSSCFGYSVFVLGVVHLFRPHLMLKATFGD